MSLAARYLLKRNIKSLLTNRRQTQRSLAFFCGRTEGWISHALLEEQRGISLTDLDRIADFFGLEVYQLFQPGIQPGTERRRHKERRSGQDRRQRR